MAPGTTTELQKPKDARRRASRQVIRGKRGIDPHSEDGGDKVMVPSSPPTEADHIALKNMFKAIAEYGRRIRLRRAECETTTSQQPMEPDAEIKNRARSANQNTKGRWAPGKSKTK